MSEFTREELMEMNIHDLRRIGSQLGVRAPTDKNKQQLVKCIMDVSSGRVAPYKTNVGRPSKTTCQIEDDEEMREKIKCAMEYHKIQKEMYEKAVDLIVENLRTYLLSAFDK